MSYYCRLCNSPKNECFAFVWVKKKCTTDTFVSVFWTNNFLSCNLFFSSYHYAFKNLCLVSRFGLNKTTQKSICWAPSWLIFHNRVHDYGSIRPTNTSYSFIVIVVDSKTGRKFFSKYCDIFCSKIVALFSASSQKFNFHCCNSGFDFLPLVAISHCTTVGWVLPLCCIPSGSSMPLPALHINTDYWYGTNVFWLLQKYYLLK